MSTAQRLAGKLLEIQRVSREVRALSEAFVKKEHGDKGIPDEGILRELWSFDGSDDMGFMCGDSDAYGSSPAKMAEDVLRYAAQKDAEKAA